MTRRTLWAKLGVIAWIAGAPACRSPSEPISKVRAEWRDFGESMSAGLYAPKADTDEATALRVEAQLTEPGDVPAAKPASIVTHVDRYRENTDLVGDWRLTGSQRSLVAKRDKGEVVRGLFVSAGVAFPPAEVLLRGYKLEAEMEVWASGEKGGPMKRVATYEICAASGELGPKRKEGDLQVPEGFYSVAYLQPASAFYLSMDVGYPNRSDRILGDPAHPGSAIMIHGGCASIGCMAMTDERIQEIWVMVSAVRQQPIHVHLFPTRQPQLLREQGGYSTHAAFWDNLYEGHRWFDAHRVPPKVTVQPDGRYTFSASDGAH